MTLRSVGGPGYNFQMRRRRGFTLIELMIVVAIISILASVAIPSYMRTVRRAKLPEAFLNLRRLYDGAVGYYAADHTDAAGHTLVRDFPATAGPTPATPPGPNRQSVPPALWKTPEWAALNFSIADPQLFSYTFGHNSTSSATIIVQGDLVGDGIYSLFQRSLTGSTSGAVSGGVGVYTVDELE